MASDSEMKKTPVDLMEYLKETLVELTGDLKKLGYDQTRLIDPLLVDTGPPVHQIPKLRAKIERMQAFLTKKQETTSSCSPLKMKDTRRNPNSRGSVGNPDIFPKVGEQQVFCIMNLIQDAMQTRTGLCFHRQHWLNFGWIRQNLQHLRVSSLPAMTKN